MANVTAEELKEINELRQKISNIVGEVGQATLQKSILYTDLEKVESTIEEHTKTFHTLMKEETELVKRLSDKYGVGSINFETGEFTPET